MDREFLAGESAVRTRLGDDTQIGRIHSLVEEVRSNIGDSQALANNLSGGLPQPPGTTSGAEKIRATISGELPGLIEKLGELVQASNHLHATLRQSVS